MAINLALLMCTAIPSSGVARAAQAPPTPASAVPCAECQALSGLPEQIAPLPDGLQGTRVLVRVGSGAGADAVRAALAAVRAKGGRAGLHLIALDAAASLLSVDVDLIVVEAPPGDADPDRAAFDLKRVLAAARGARPDAQLAVAGDPAALDALRERGIDPYVDRLLPRATQIHGLEDLLTTSAGTSLHVWTLPEDAGAAQAIAAAAAALQSWLPSGLAAVPARALTCAGHPLSTFLNPQTLDLVAVSRECPPGAPVASDIRGAIVERMEVGGATAYRVRAGTTEGFATGVDVAASRTLTVEEIVARHQAAAARQAASIATEIAHGSMTLTFEAPGFVAPVTVTSQTTIYTGEERIDLRQREITVNGVRFDAHGGVPRLPIIEPERAAAPPLAITLSDLYRYRLDKRETIDGREAFVVAFAPRDADAALYSGRAWIDAETFGMMRVSAAQTGLKGPITASEQTDEFRMDAEGRWLLARSDVHQTYEGASVRTPIHRRVVIDQHEINPPDFEARRDEAYRSPDVMLRDTPDGYRYLKPATGSRQPETGDQRPATGDRQPAAEVRVVAGRADRIRTFAFGVIIDPNISVPLPFAGLSYVDFNLFGTGTQFNGFFGGSFGQLAFSAPSIRGTRWQLAGRAFGIASSYNDRAFDQGREQYVLGIRQRPAQAAVWLLRPLSARASLRIEYDWDYNAFGRADTTAPAFVVPRNQNAHGLRVGLDLQRGGWQASLWGSYTRRIGWRAWGVPGVTPYRPAHADYQRYGASLLRSQALSTRLAVRVEAAAMGGADLDRFSRYAFGTFDNRLHGYPSALIRYDRGGVLRTAIAWTALKGLRVDGFADTAAVHDPGFGRGLRRYTGFGAALEAPAPFGTLIAVEWGYGVQGIDTEGRTGTHVIRVSGYKVF